jgi:uncharacterized tellurite resistance protein B-like protein
MIIWGSRGLTSTVDSQPFHCPQCDRQRQGDLKQVRTFFTLYFIPLIPLSVAGRYVECTSCGGTFAEDALTYDPEAERQEMQMHMLRVMVMAALADGQLDDGERGEIRKQYMELAGLPIPEDTLNREIQLASASGANLNSFVAGLADQLSPHGKALLVQLTLRTMAANGDLQPGHQQQLAQLATTLQIPQDQYLELIRHLHGMENEATG